MNGSTGPRVHGSTGQRATESGSVAGSGAQPLLDNNANHKKDKNNNDDMMVGMFILITIKILQGS